MFIISNVTFSVLVFAEFLFQVSRATLHPLNEGCNLKQQSLNKIFMWRWCLEGSMETKAIFIIWSIWNITKDQLQYSLSSCGRSLSMEACQWRLVYMSVVVTFCPNSGEEILTGLLRLRLPQRSLTLSWDFSVVLYALCDPPFKPLSTLYESSPALCIADWVSDL